MANEWTPLACLSGLVKDSVLPKDQKLKVALVVVNMPLDGMIDKFKALSNIATVKAYTDGGASQVCSVVGDEKERYLADFVSGDFDSVDPELLNFYREKCIEVIPTPDQDETDLTKCLRILTSKKHIDKFDEIVVINALGKRLDQTMANIETLFHITKLTKKPVYLMSEDSMACLITPGKHIIHVNTGLEGDWCGLIPIGAKCTHITTTGLKWNLTDGQLEFGTLVSTSNTYDGSNVVTIETDTAILWTMGVK
ncbi:hypothetical protein ACROYT_G026765 [Oculina patagonica]